MKRPASIFLAVLALAPGCKKKRAPKPTAAPEDAALARVAPSPEREVTVLRQVVLRLADPG